MKLIFISIMATLLMACTAQNHGEERQIIFHVEGMFCESCVGAVTNEIERMNGTSNVNVTLEDSTVVFTIPANRVPDRETIRESIERLGYTVHFDLGSNQ